MWQPEDEALLQRLEDEEVVGLLWQADAPGAAPLHPRAAGLVHVLRDRAAGCDAIVAMLKGNAEPLRDLVQPESMAGLPAPLLHHIAIYNARLAEVADRPAQATERTRLCSLAAWIALADEQRYLTELARAVLGSAQEIESAIEEAAMRPLDGLGEAARQGARDLTSAAADALRTLRHAPDACRLSGCSAVVAQRFERYAERLVASAIEATLAPIREALSDATARGQAEQEGAQHMQRIADAWAWAEGDEHIERFALDVVMPIAWSHYHEDRSDSALGRLLRPLEPLVKRLAWRIEADPSKIAYAAPCAQMYVFLSELCSQPEDRRRWAERSLEICPTHRNGRLILANLLLQEIGDRLDRSTVFLQRADFDELTAKLARVEELYPRAKNLDDLKVRLGEARNASWWSR